MSTLATTNIKHESASTPNITLTSGGTTTVNGTLNLGSSPLATPTGSAPSYTCRAWVTFDGTTNTGGFCTVRASGNVSSVADNGTGDYTVNFTTAMPDANYCPVFGNSNSTSQNDSRNFGVRTTALGGDATTKTTTALRVQNRSGTNTDDANLSVAIFS
jgi:hypothetical protein